MKPFELDKRYTGYRIFVYGIDFDRHAEFFNIREWCWQSFGPGCELEYYYIYSRLPGKENVTWAWSKNDYRSRIYLQSDKELQWYLLKWAT